jgi:PhnB protein
MVKPIPDGYHTVTPYLLVNDAARLIEFLKDGLGAEEIGRMPGPDGAIAHAEVRIGNSVVMMGQPGEGNPGATTSALYLYFEDVDAVYKRAVAAGGVSTEEPADQFYGDRRAGVRDPCGNTWWLATHIKDVPT